MTLLIFLDLMGKMRQYPRSVPGGHFKRSCWLKAGRRKNEDRLVQPPSDGDNPLDLPLVLVQALESSAPDVLAIVLQHIDDLPPSVQATFGQHFETAYLVSLRDMCSGLSKLRENTMPTEDELDVIAHPHNVFSSLTVGFRTVATYAKLPLATGTFIERNIAEPLAESSNTFLPGPAAGLVEWWFLRLREARDEGHDPFDEATPTGP